MNAEFPKPERSGTPDDKGGKEEVKENEAVQLLTTIFNQVLYIDGIGEVTPFDVEEKLVTENDERKTEYREKMERFQQILEARRILGTDIDREKYGKWKELVNELARQVAGERFREESRHHFDLKKEDRLAQEVPDTECKRYKAGLKGHGTIKIRDLPDGKYSRINVFGHKRSDTLSKAERGMEDTSVKADEGYAYHRVYDEEGNLRKIRIFAQEHRNNLTIKTVSIEEIIQHLDSIPKPKEPEIIEKPPELNDPETFSQEIDSFNRTYGSIVRVDQFCGDYPPEDKVGLIFQANPEQVLNELRKLAPKFGLEVDRNQCINKGSWENRLGSLVVVKESKDSSSQKTYDEETQYDLARDADIYTALQLLYLNVEQLAPLVQEYIKNNQ